MLCFRIELSENVINELIRRKRLTADYRADPKAVGEALQRYLQYHDVVTRNVGRGRERWRVTAEDFV